MQSINRLGMIFCIISYLFSTAVLLRSSLTICAGHDVKDSAKVSTAVHILESYSESL